MGFNEKGPSPEQIEADYQKMLEQEAKEDMEKSTNLSNFNLEESLTPEGARASDTDLEKSYLENNIPIIKREFEKVKSDTTAQINDLKEDIMLA